jgi:hypothetical protein
VIGPGSVVGVRGFDRFRKRGGADAGRVGQWLGCIESWVVAVPRFTSRGIGFGIAAVIHDSMLGAGGVGAFAGRNRWVALPTPAWFGLGVITAGGSRLGIAGGGWRVG